MLGTSSTTKLGMETGTTDYVHYALKLELDKVESGCAPLLVWPGVSCESHSRLGRRSQSLERYVGGSVKRWVIGESRVGKPQPGHQIALLC